MSKTFDALRRLEDQASGLPKEPITSPEAAVRDPAHSESRPERKLSLDQNANSRVASIKPPAQFEVTRPRILPMRLSADSPLFPFDHAQHEAGEQYRIVRTKIVQHPKSPKVIAVSSADPGDGKTVTSINLAGVLALKTDVNILLVDCDLRLGRVGQFLGIPETPGLTEVLLGTNTLQETIVQAEHYPNLHILPSGVRPGNPTELLDSPPWMELIGKLRTQFDYIILDSPPIGGVADFDLIQAVSDGVTLVARPDSTNRARCMHAIASVATDKLLGVVLNCVEDWFFATKTFYSSYYGQIPERKS